MRWSNDLPTRPGWWWLSAPETKPAVVRIQAVGPDELMVLGIGDTPKTPPQDCEWAGPIPLPESELA